MLAAAMKTCFTSCKTQEITDSTNPYKAYYECQNTCLGKIKYIIPKLIIFHIIN